MLQRIGWFGRRRSLIGASAVVALIAWRLLAHDSADAAAAKGPMEISVETALAAHADVPAYLRASAPSRRSTP